jgi:hypothetical protein
MLIKILKILRVHESILGCEAFMKKCLALLLLSLTSCSTPISQRSVLAGHSLEYLVSENEYVVVIVREGGLSKEVAKKQALVKAAEITIKNNLRYFQVKSEKDVQVAKSSSSEPDSQNAPRNLYYELIQSDNFGKEPIKPPPFPPEKIYPAYRIEFQCFLEKPSKQAIDACSLTSCSK